MICDCSRNPGTDKTANANPSTDSRLNSGAPVLALSILPQEHFVRRIGLDRIQTIVLAGQNQNPHSYEPNPRQLQDLAGADAWILSGTEFEIALEPKIRSLFPSLTIIDGTAGVHFRSIEDHDEEDDDHDHGKDAIDRHTWLGSEGAQIMASHIRDTLCNLDEANASFYNENYSRLVNDIREEFDHLKAELAILRGKTVLVYHPAFGYFLDEFGVIQDAVETGGKEPSPRMLAQIIGKARADNVKVIFVQAQFPVESAGTVARAAGAELFVLDPLAADWLENIRYMGEALKRAIQ